MKNFYSIRMQSWKWIFQLIIFLMFCNGNVFVTKAASPLNQKLEDIFVNLELNDATPQEFFDLLREKTGVYFFYSNEDVETLDGITIESENESLKEVLDKVFEDAKLEYHLENNVVTIKKIVEQTIQKKENLKVTGKVTDEKGLPLPGVTVQIQGKMMGVVTDLKGKYSVEVVPTDALKFSFVGYKTQLIMVEGKEKINVRLFPNIESINEVVVTGFGSQKKESAVSAINSVDVKQLKSSNSDLTSSLAGNVSGMIAWQTGGAPGALTEDEMNTKFAIRGITSFQSKAKTDPLILLDGVEVSKLDLARIDPDDIESFNVFKDASATAMYGARGANGVIYLKTKKGKAGNVRVTFRCEKIFSMPTSEIDVVDPVSYMKFYNEALLARDPNAEPFYTAEKIKRTASGKYPDYVYPKNDWYKKLFKDHSVNTHYALNARGGTNKMQYYISIGHNEDNGMIKTDKLNEFSPNIKSKQTTFRTNMNITLSDNAQLTLNSFSTYDKYNGPFVDIKGIYGLAFQADPVGFAPVYPAEKGDDWDVIRFGTGTGKNPYREVQRGYSHRKRYSTINKAEYIQRLDALIKGLEIRLSTSMVKDGNFGAYYYYKPFNYKLASYNHVTGEHKLSGIGNSRANRTLEVEGDKSYASGSTSMEYKMMLMYNTEWDDHTLSLNFIANKQEKDRHYPRSVLKSLPQRNLGYSGRISYGYKNRYFLEASAGYNGSERFSEDNRMGFFPSVGGAWLISDENFFNSVNHWFDYAKIRLSYGKVGNDGVIRDPRFVYMPDISISNRPRYKIGDPKVPANYYDVNGYPNEDTKWEIAEQVNLGMEMKFFKNMVELNADIYQEIRHNIYSYRTNIPSHNGFLMPPLANVGKVRSRGVDLSLKIQKSINKDFYFIVNGTFTYNKAKYLELEEADGIPSYQSKIGHDISQRFGYVAEGLFQDQEEIDNSPKQSGDVQPGDIRYRDIDGNGKIDVNDRVAIGHPTTPRIIYGFNGFVHYKNFEFNISFQGSGQRSFWIDPQRISPLNSHRAMFTDIAKNHWSEDNKSNHPLWPKLSTENITHHNPEEQIYDQNGEQVGGSTYFMRNGSFLRCKTIEGAVYLNESFAKKLKLQKAKFYLRLNNPFIISDFKMWDVELGESGFNYPIQKTYSLGMSLTF